MKSFGRGLVALATIPVLAGTVAPAFAGTKFQTNIVPSSAVHPPTSPTLTTKSKFKLDDKAAVQANLKGVTDGGGLPVTTSTSVKDTGDVDATSYAVVIRGTFTASATPFESAVAVDLKNGNGVGKLSLTSLLPLLPAGSGRSVEVNGVEVWGPLGAGKVASCNALLNAGFSVVPGDPACRGGDMIGVGGINIPVPAP